MQQFSSRYNTAKLNIIDHRFITFGLVHGFIRRVYEYAVNVDHNATFKKIPSSRNKNNKERASYPTTETKELSERETGLSRILPLLDGTHHVDEICTTFMRSHAELSQMFKARHRVTTVFK